MAPQISKVGNDAIFSEDIKRGKSCIFVEESDGRLKLVEPIEGPADNEIWYTTSDRKVSNYEMHDYSKNTILSNTYMDNGCVTFNSSITNICGNVDYGCSSFYTEDGRPTLIGDRVVSVILPNTVHTIDAYGFGQLYELTSITLPGSILNIGAHAFYNCQSLRDIYFNGTKEQWDSIQKYSDDGYMTWNQGCPEITVHCTDGDITIPAWTEPA